MMQVEDSDTEPDLPPQRNICRHRESWYAVRLAPKEGDKGPFYEFYHKEQIRDFFDFDCALHQGDPPSCPPGGYFTFANAFTCDAQAANHTHTALANTTWDRYGNLVSIDIPRGMRSPTPQEVLRLDADLRTQCKIKGHDRFTASDYHIFQQLLVSNANQVARREAKMVKDYQDREQRRESQGARSSGNCHIPTSHPTPFLQPRTTDPHSHSSSHCRDRHERKPYS
ncbi:hypothetical protein V8B97DRAFT_373116 [Scleroderma yunnanense]